VGSTRENRACYLFSLQYTAGNSRVSPQHRGLQ
jgi:hypothetical protein